MLNLPNVTLINVGSTKIPENIRAIEYCLEGVTFADVKFVTHTYPQNLPNNIKFEECPRLKSIDEYSHYMIYNLHKHVDTDFCLTIQHDGFILRPDKWQSRFLDYDYIGAPWPISHDSFISPFNEHIRVGNGGFSLRSKKLLLVPTIEEIPWEVTKGDFYKHMNANNYNEDGNICVHNRHLFEKHGCVFAPVEVAAHFSQEIQVPETEGIFSFGFHGRMK